MVKSLNKSNDDDVLEQNEEGEVDDDLEKSEEDDEDDKPKHLEKIETLKNTIREELNQMTFEEIKNLQNKIGLKK